MQGEIRGSKDIRFTACPPLAGSEFKVNLFPFLVTRDRKHPR